MNSSLIRQRQQGVILVVAMVMLLAMTLIGITVMSSATLQERMAGNNRQLSLARLYAESALRQAELDLNNLNLEDQFDVLSQFTGKTGFYYWESIDHQSGNPLGDDLSRPENWNVNNSSEVASVVGGNSSITFPRYTIEYIGFLGDPTLEFTTGPSINDSDRFDELDLGLAFRITAIGYGRDQNITSILESIYTTQQGSTE